MELVSYVSYHTADRPVIPLIPQTRPCGAWQVKNGLAGLTLVSPPTDNGIFGTLNIGKFTTPSMWALYPRIGCPITGEKQPLSCYSCLASTESDQ